MPATEVAKISYPDGDSPYDFVAALAATASSTDLALQDRANAWRGPGAMRVARKNELPEGALWADEDGNKTLHQKRGGEWWPEIEFHNVHVISPNFSINSNALAISNFGRVAHLSCHFFQIQTFSWGNKQTIQLGTFDDKWAPPPGGLTVTIPMSTGFDNSSTGTPWKRQDLIVGKRDDPLPVFDSRIMIYNPDAAWGNTYTTPDKRAGLSFSVSWPLSN